MPGDFYFLSANARALGTLSYLVKFTVVWQVRLWHDPKDFAAKNDYSAVEQLSPAAQRRPDDNDGEEIARGRDDIGDTRLYAVEQRVLE